MSIVEIRPIRDQDDFEELTRIIRAAYRSLSDMGLMYWATYQSIEDTRKRFEDGLGLVAIVNEILVGTLTIYGPRVNSEVEIYQESKTYNIGQFAVDPLRQGNGIGKQLHEYALEHIISCGGTRCALDTAEQATHLIKMYEKWGYFVAGEADWRPVTNYRSVVMVKDLTPRG